MTRRIIVLLLVSLLILLSRALDASAQTSDEGLYLTRSQAQTMVLEDNYSLELLEVESVSLMGQFEEAVEEDRLLTSLYKQLSNYEYLGNKYDVTMANGNYETYLELLIDGVGDGREDDLEDYLSDLAVDESEIEEGTAVVQSDLYYDVELRIELEDSFDDDDYSAMLTADEYYEYLDLVEDFEDAGIYSTDLSDDDLYDTFIYKMKIAPLLIQSDIKVFQLEEEAQIQSMINSMLATYDGALSAMISEEEAYVAYETAKAALTEAEDYLELGKISESAYSYAEYDVQIAYLDYTISKRSAENKLMDLKQLLGLEPEVNLSLDESLQSLEVVSEEVYMASAGISPEIQQQELDIYYTSEVRDTVGEYLGESSEDYLDLVEAVIRLEEDMAQLEQTSLTATKIAYNALMTDIARLSYDEAVLSVNQLNLEQTMFMYDIGHGLWRNIVNQQEVMEDLNRGMLVDQLDTMASIRSLNYSSGLYATEID